MLLQIFTRALFILFLNIGVHANDRGSCATNQSSGSETCDSKDSTHTDSNPSVTILNTDIVDRNDKSTDKQRSMNGKRYDILNLFNNIVFESNGSKFVDDNLYEHLEELVGSNFDDCEYIRWRTGANLMKQDKNASLIGCSYYNNTELAAYGLESVDLTVKVIKGIVISMSYFHVVGQRLHFIGDLDFSNLKQSKLSSLQLYATTAFTFYHIQGVSQLVTLKSLAIYYAEIKDIDFDDISESNLLELALIHCGLRGTIDLQKISNSQSLKYVTIRYNKVNNVLFGNINNQNSSKLLALTLSNNDLSGSFSLLPFELSNVKYINLAGNKINSIDLSELPMNSTLHTLILSNNSLNGIFDLRGLISMNLKVLELEYNQIDEIKFTVTWAALQVIKLSGNPLISSNKQLRPFFKHLLNMNPNLAKIYFKNCKTDGKDVLVKDLQRHMEYIVANIIQRPNRSTTIFINNGHCVISTNKETSTCVEQ